MNESERKHIRSIVRRVHPDLFTQHPDERQQNSEALKVLNSYVDNLAQGWPPGRATLLFWVKEPNDQLEKIEAELPASGSLGPLLFAFGLISEEELKSGAGNVADDTNFLEWLRDAVRNAVKTADEHESMRQRLRIKCREMEEKYELASLQVLGEFGSGLSAQHQHLEALNVLDQAMQEFSASDSTAFSELCFYVYHPEYCPVDCYSYVDSNGMLNMRTERIRSDIREDGSVVLVADKDRIFNDLLSLDLARARLLTRADNFWRKRVRSLTPAVRELLGVDHVHCDYKTDNQKFVLWAGHLLEHRGELERLLGKCRFSFALVISSDPSAPMVEYFPHTSILQVRTDCPLNKLLEFLTSEAADAASRAAEDVASARKEEEDLLARVCQALGAKHVIRLCSLYERDKVMDGAKRLLANADKIRGVVDLTGASIAIDDCYQVWSSGFISVPYDFELQELKPRLLKMLAAASEEQVSTGAADPVNGVNGVNGAPTANGASPSMANWQQNGNSSRSMATAAMRTHRLSGLAPVPLGLRRAPVRVPGRMLSGAGRVQRICSK